MLKSTLEKAGYTVSEEARDGYEAVQLYKKIKPDLVMLDITMPKLSGLQAVKEIKSYDKNANIVMCSAMGQHFMVIDAIKSGAKDFIVKPFQPERIIEVVNNILHKKY